MVCDFSLIVCCFGYCRSSASKTLNFINTYMPDTRYLATTTRSSQFCFSVYSAAFSLSFLLGHTDAIMKFYLWFISFTLRILSAWPSWHIVRLINGVAKRLLKFITRFFTEKLVKTSLKIRLKI